MVSKIFALATVALVLGCDAPVAADEVPAPPTAPRVEVMAVELEARRYRVRSLGEIRPAAEHRITVRAPGRVRSVHADVGDRVEAGHVLLRLDPRRGGLALERAQTSVERAEVDLRRAEQELKRIRRLRGRRVVGDQALEQAEARAELARAALADAKAADRLAHLDLSEGTVRAPIDGIVTRRAVEPGQRVQPAESLMILDAESLEVATWISERDVRGSRIGDAARVGLWGRESGWTANVAEIGRRADPRTGNFPVRLRLGHDGDARVGLTVEVEFEIRADTAAVKIPEKAVVTRGRRLAVFVVEDGVARRVHPRLGPPLDGQVPVFEGLAAGQSVVVDGATRIVDGAHVEMVP